MFSRDDSGEAVTTSEGVADQVGAVFTSINHVIVDDIAEITGKGVECGFIETDAQATKLHVSKIQSMTTLVTVREVETVFCVSTQSAKLSFRSGVRTKSEAAVDIICIFVLLFPVASATFKLVIPLTTGITIFFAGISITTASSLETNVTGDAQACFCAWNVEVASAVCIANAYIFNSFWFWCNDGVGSLSAGYCNESCSGAEKKALNVHF
ncbi:hypothetical protein [Pseudochrobactrum asaccharolyticum]|uniref:hypothetical protein n=1 Tax=Pseudochrobactrum asaccharolyticum TaxID=354351 RepID=UPI0040449CB4